VDKTARIEKCKAAIHECENNLENFKNGNVVPQSGEVQANKRALSMRKDELSKLQMKQAIAA
jgi:hypothetical protein